MPRLKKIHCEDPQLDRVQDAVSNAYDEVASNPLINGTFLQEVQIEAGTPKLLAHKLLRKPFGYLIVKKSANSTIWDSGLTQSTLTLNSSADVTVNIYVF